MPSNKKEKADTSLNKTNFNTTREDSALLDIQMLDLDDGNDLNSEIIS